MSQPRLIDAVFLVLTVAMISLAAFSGCSVEGNGGSQSDNKLSSIDMDVSQSTDAKPRGRQELTLTFQCDTLTDYTAIDSIKPVVKRLRSDGALKLSVENFLMICADRVKAVAEFDVSSRRLGVDMKPEGLKHCLCKYELDPIAIGVPNDARVNIEDFLLTLSKTESDTHKVMFEGKLGSIPYKELDLPRPE